MLDTMTFIQNSHINMNSYYLTALKQLNWEAERDRWVKGYKNFTGGKTSGGKAAGGRKKGKPLGVKKPSFKPNKKPSFKPNKKKKRY